MFLGVVAPTDIDSYLSSFPEDVRVSLRSLRAAIHEVVPDAEEAIRYDIPTFTLDGRNLVHFAGWKRSVSMYPVPVGDGAFEAAIAPFRSGKSTARFKLGDPLPVELVQAAVRLLLARRQ